jgi:hypothetical protein
MLSQIVNAVNQAIQKDLPNVNDDRWGIVNGRAAVLENVQRRPLEHEIEIFSFPQTWSSTALGFSGIGGQAMTTAQTVVISMEGNAWVYIGGQLAYRVDNWHRNEAFTRDMKNHHMASQFESFKRYKNVEL